MTDTKFVYDELLKLGIDVYGYHIRIHDVGLSTIMLHGGKNITRKTAGLAVHCGHRHDIYLLSSLSNTKRKGVLAHELGHVWLQEHRSPLRHLRVENEGFCELLAYKIFGAINTSEARLLRRGMLAGRIPIYSDGFRMMRRRAEDMGWEAFLSAADGLNQPAQTRTRPRFVIRDTTPPRLHIVDLPISYVPIQKPFSITKVTPARFNIKSG